MGVHCQQHIQTIKKEKVFYIQSYFEWTLVRVSALQFLMARNLHCVEWGLYSTTPKGTLGWYFGNLKKLLCELENFASFSNIYFLSLLLLLVWIREANIRPKFLENSWVYKYIQIFVATFIPQKSNFYSVFEPWNTSFKSVVALSITNL